MHASWVHRQAGIYPANFFEGSGIVPKRILSIFIDESGDFGPFQVHSPNYYVAMVFHDQSEDISEYIRTLDFQLENIGYPNHTIHTGPIIRKELVYRNDLMENRRRLFNVFLHFARKVPINYICPRIDKSHCEDTELAYISKLSKSMADELKKHFDYLNSFDLLNVYYDYGQPNLTTIITSVFNALFSNVEMRKVQPADYKLFQVADLICTMELTKDKADRNAFSKSELEFFHSARCFKKNLYKNLEKKKL